MSEFSVKKYKNKIISGILVIMFMLVFSFTTSPLFHINKLGQDSTVFLMMGKGILEGKIPFVDLFENKGPLLYFIEAFPQIFINGAFGVWLLQVSIAIINIFLLNKISKKFLNKSNELFITVSYIGYLALCYDGGNLSEEYNLLFIILALYVFVSYICDKENNNKGGYGLLLGICFTSVVMIRLTDVLAIGGIILVLIYFTLANKLYKSLIKNIGTFLVGMMIIIFPIVTYYIINGALKEMIKGYFLINTKYVTTGMGAGLSDRINLIHLPYGKVVIFIFILSLIAAIIVVIKNRSNNSSKANFISILLFILSILGVLTVLISKSAYFHYLIILIPQVIISLLIIKEFLMELYSKYFSSKVLSKIAPLIIILGTIIFYKYYNDNIYYIVPPVRDIFYLNPVSTNVKNIKEIIPIEDYDDIYVLNIFSNWYRQMGIYPAYKHFLLMVYVQIDENLKYEFEEYMINTPPKWLVINEKEYNHYDLLTKTTLEIFSEQYEEVYSDSVATLYREK